MGVSHSSAASHFLSLEGTSNLVFCVQFESQPLQKWYNVNHEGRVYVFRSFFTLPYESKEAQEPLQQQCMSLLAVQHPFCRCQEGTPNLAFCVQFESQRLHK